MARQILQFVQQHIVDAAAEAGRTSWVGERMKSTSLCELLADAGTQILLSISPAPLPSLFPPLSF